MIAIGEPLMHVAGNGDVTLTGSGLVVLLAVVVCVAIAALR